MPMSLPMPIHLLGTAQTLAQASFPVVKMIVALGVVVVLAAILLGALSIVRRRMREEGAFAPKGFSLGDLRDLHRAGKLSTEEFERAKAKLVSGVQSTLAKERTPSRTEERFGQELKDV
jgi:hypothetical protein